MENQENNIAPRKVNLSICGGNRTLVDYDQVVGVPTPPVEFRKKENANGERAISYQPIAHHDLVTRARGFLDDQGFTIQDEVHSLARNDNHYFGLFNRKLEWQLKHVDGRATKRSYLGDGRLGDFSLVF